MNQDYTDIRQLLERSYAGDREALDQILSRSLPWIRQRVSRRLGGKLRRKAETGDLVQEVALRLLKSGPRFLVSNEAQFRALLGRMIENVICDQHDWFSAQRRSIDRESPIPRDSVIDLDPAGRTVERPSQVVERREAETWTQLAISLLDPEERQIIRERQWDGASFAEIGERLGVTPDSARMRFNRALTRLAEKIVLLKSGQVERATQLSSDDEAKDQGAG